MLFRSGPVAVITAFNFPMAVWAWNAALAAVCGDTMVWKPSSKTPLTAVAVQNLCNRVLERHGLDGVFTLVIGRGADVGEKMLADRRMPLISATGSCRMGRRIAHVVGDRLGRTLLELGGNNAVISAIGPSGCHCSNMRWRPRSDCMVMPQSWRLSPTA